MMGVPESEARKAAIDAVTSTSPLADLPTDVPSDRRPGQPIGLQYYNAPHVQFVGDFLAILSFVSDSTYGKVRAFRAWLRRGTPADAQEEHEWEARREELARYFG